MGGGGKGSRGGSGGGGASGGASGGSRSGGSNAGKGASGSVGRDNTSNKRHAKEDTSWLWILAVVAMCVVVCVILGPALVSSMIERFKSRKSDTFI